MQNKVTHGKKRLKGGRASSVRGQQIRAKASGTPGCEEAAAKRTAGQSTEKHSNCNRGAEEDAEKG